MFPTQKRYMGRGESLTVRMPEPAPCRGACLSLLSMVGRETPCIRTEELS